MPPVRQDDGMAELISVLHGPRAAATELLPSRRNRIRAGVASQWCLAAARVALGHAE